MRIKKLLIYKNAGRHELNLILASHSYHSLTWESTSEMFDKKKKHVTLFLNEIRIVFR